MVTTPGDLELKPAVFFYPFSPMDDQRPQFQPILINRYRRMESRERISLFARQKEGLRLAFPMRC